MKHLLRQESLQKRLNQPPILKKERENKIQDYLFSSKLVQEASTILFYYPIKEEVDLLPLFEKLKKEKFCCFPRIDTANNHQLSLHQIQELSDLETGTYNIPQPTATSPKVEAAVFDVILVPGVMFAHDGHRLGYGKGYYDRLLKTTQCPHIGIAFEFQITEKLPNEPHDVPVTMIVTENGFIECNEGKYLF